MMLRTSSKKIGLFALVILFIVVEVAADTNACQIQPMWLEQKFPDTGFRDIDDDTKVKNACETKLSWKTFLHQNTKFFVAVSGPKGSGRYWQVTIGLGDVKSSAPTRGVCFTVSTIGWRTLQRFRHLEWIANTDTGQTPQLIVWTSFYLDDSSQAQRSGLSVWVYRFTHEGLQFDEVSTRRLALELQKAYQKPLARSNLRVYRSRKQIAKTLRAIATGKCQFKSPDPQVPDPPETAPEPAQQP